MKLTGMMEVKSANEGGGVYFILFYFILLPSPQGQGHHNSVSQLLWACITHPTLSTFPVGGNRSTRRKPTSFGRALTLTLALPILFSPEDWVRVYLNGNRTRNLRVERRVVSPLHHRSPRFLSFWLRTQY